MGLYSKYVLPRLTHVVCAQKPTMMQREKIIPLATGRVLEVGIGSGLNLPYYDPRSVNRLWGLDPSRELWAIAERHAAEYQLEAEFLEATAESIPLDDQSADTVVVTYTLCTVPDVARALAEIKRVLKPGGRLLYCEHGEAPDPKVRAWQDRMTPLWSRFGGGCQLNRPIPKLLEDAGFRSTDMQTMYLPGWKPLTFNFWGSAQVA